MDNPLGTIHFKLYKLTIIAFFQNKGYTSELRFNECTHSMILLTITRSARITRSTALVVNSMVDSRISHGSINHKTATTFRTPPPSQDVVRFRTIFDRPALASPRCHHLLGNQTIDGDLGRLQSQSSFVGTCYYTFSRYLQSYACFGLNWWGGMDKFHFLA